MHPENSWKTLKGTVKYDNPWIKVTEFDVLNPAGGLGIYGVVHFKNIAIGILPIDEEGNTWIVGQHRYPLNQYSWELPEGGCPEHTDPLESAKRELKEETGITAKEWTPFLEVHTSNSVSDEYGIFYLAKGLTFGEAEPEATEDLQVRKLPFTKLVDMVMQGEITDAFTVCAVLKAKILLGY